MWWHTRRNQISSFGRNGRVHLNRRGRQFSRLLAVEVCASAVVIVDTPYSEVVWSVLATHSIRQFPLHFPSRASPCAITFQLESNNDRHHQISFIYAECKRLQDETMYTGLTMYADRNFSIPAKRQLISELLYIYSCQTTDTCSGHWHTLKHRELSRSPLLLNLPREVVQILKFFWVPVLCSKLKYKTNFSKSILRRYQV